MRTPFYSFVFVTLFLLPSVSRAQWTSLFNGKDLTGWEQRGGKAMYTVENGEIIGTTVSNTPNSFLCTQKEYGDFILEVTLKVEGSMNSGIQIRSLSKPDYQNGRVHGYQVEVDPSSRAWSGGIYDESRRGWLYIPEMNPEGKKAFKVGVWNVYRIEAIGNTISTFVNGVPVAHLVDDMTAKGFIALQLHSIGEAEKPGMKIKWKDVRVQTQNLKQSSLGQTPVINLVDNTLSAQEKALGYALLFDGKDMTHWREVGSTEAPKTRWNVENGTMRVYKSDGSETGNDIVSREKYSAFEFVFDFRMTPGANSGVKYFVDESVSPRGRSAIGLEFQVLDDELHPDAKAGVVGNRTLGSLYDLIPSAKPEPRFKRPIGDWNQGRIVVYPDNIVQHWLNGFLVVEYERNSNIYNALVARSKYVTYKDFGAAEEGLLLLQDHGDDVSFKNLKIRKL